jgi:Flp pilus assembly protein TadG
MAMVAPLLIMLMFGIVEFGMMFHTQMQLNNMVREGARVAAIGAQPAEIESRLETSGSISTDDMTVTQQYRTYLGGGTWSAWQTLGTGTYNNTAPSGAEVRVQSEYPYHLTVGALFSFVVDRPTERIQTLRTTTIMRRE